MPLIMGLVEFMYTKCKVFDYYEINSIRIDSPLEIRSIVGRRKVCTYFGKKCEESSRKASKAATEKEKTKSNQRIQHVLR